VALLRTGSAYFSPASAAIRMTEAYLFDKKEILPCAALLEGEYGVKGYYFCVPVVIGAGGVEKIIDINLSAADKKAFDESLNHVKDIVQAMDRILGVA
jgi:malate dehydrogenase